METYKPDIQLRACASEKLCEDYRGVIEDFDRDIKELKGDKRVHKIEYDDNSGFHFYHRKWVEYQSSKKVSYIYQELKLTEQEKDLVLDEFNAWY